jgi:hypothetical protein
VGPAGMGLFSPGVCACNNPGNMAAIIDRRVASPARRNVIDCNKSKRPFAGKTKYDPPTYSLTDCEAESRRNVEHALLKCL